MAKKKFLISGFRNFSTQQDYYSHAVLSLRHLPSDNN